MPCLFIYTFIYFIKANSVEIQKSILIMIFYYHSGPEHQTGKICYSWTVVLWWKIIHLCTSTWMIEGMGQLMNSSLNWESFIYSVIFFFFFLTKFSLQHGFYSLGKSVKRRILLGCLIEKCIERVRKVSITSFTYIGFMWYFPHINRIRRRCTSQCNTNEMVWKLTFLLKSKVYFSGMTWTQPVKTY